MLTNARQATASATRSTSGVTEPPTGSLVSAGRAGRRRDRRRRARGRPLVQLHGDAVRIAKVDGPAAAVGARGDLGRLGDQPDAVAAELRARGAEVLHPEA